MPSLNRRLFRAALFSAGMCYLAAVASAQVETKHFKTDVSSAVKPWTHLDFYNDPRNFHFALISDRAGGVRPGVFQDGAEKLNLLMPEFVMSVGDFIPGNTSDRAKLEAEWAEFDQELSPLKVPFFFVPGNHDINNDVMREIWMERYGVPFYSFVYKNVLFLALDSTGEKGYIVPEYQVEYFKKTLAEHADVRWTFVFMHHPLWLYPDSGGFGAIQELLKGRKHTVFAGHTHHYLHERYDDANYYILGTTGGGSQLRGTRFGEFDHVSLVTMTDEGPVLANLRLEGILPHDVTTREDYELTRALLTSTEMPYTLLTDGEDAVSSGTLYLRLQNPSKNQLQVKADFMHGHQVAIDPPSLDLTLEPGEEQRLQFQIRSSEAVPTDKPALLRLDWNMGYELEDKEQLYLSGTKQMALKPSNFDLIKTVAPEYTGRLSIAMADTEPGYSVRYTVDGTTPDADSPLYDSPFDIDDEKTVKARMFNEAGHGSNTSTQSYKPIATGSGLRYRFYAGSWTRLPDFDTLKPVFESLATDLNVESRQLWSDNWAMLLEGNLHLERDGEYTFHVNSDDGCKLLIDGKVIVDNDGDHSLLELSGKTQLSAGSHRLRIEFFEAGGEAILEIDMEGPGIERQPLPFENISH